MRIPGSKTLKRSARWVRSRYVEGALILGYHRIADEPFDPYQVCVKPEYFREQMEVLRLYCSPLSLSELVQSLKKNDLPRKAVVITFDDGYADNLYVAKPILEKHNLPATVFVATGYIGGMFWWDELAGMMQSTQDLTKGFNLSVNGRTFRWKPGNSKGEQKREGTFPYLENLLQSLYAFLMDLATEDRQKALSQISSLAVTGSNFGQLPRSLSVDELAQVAEAELLEVGAHTVSHPKLVDLPENDQRFEIQQSKKYLEEILNRPVTHFSYPNGSFSDTTEAIVKISRYQSACASTNDVVWRGSDAFRLPRFWVRNCNGDTFSKWLRHWLKN
jgi:peptidoglycan/xylan/chitin deacetylase (PgdA/CDA1 family)